MSRPDAHDAGSVSSAFALSSETLQNSVTTSSALCQKFAPEPSADNVRYAPASEAGWRAPDGEFVPGTALQFPAALHREDMRLALVDASRAKRQEPAGGLFTGMND